MCRCRFSPTWVPTTTTTTRKKIESFSKLNKETLLTNHSFGNCCAHLVSTFIAYTPSVTRKERRTSPSVQSKVSTSTFAYFIVTSVDDGFPLEEPALVGDGVEVAALSVSEGRQASWTSCRVADPVPPPLPQTVLPSVLWTERKITVVLLLLHTLPPAPDVVYRHSRLVWVGCLTEEDFKQRVHSWCIAIRITQNLFECSVANV